MEASPPASSSASERRIAADIEPPAEIRRSAGRRPLRKSSAASSTGRFVGKPSTRYPTRSAWVASTSTRQPPSVRLHARSSAAEPSNTVVGSGAAQSCSRGDRLFQALLSVISFSVE